MDSLLLYVGSKYKELVIEKKNAYRTKVAYKEAVDEFQKLLDKKAALQMDEI